MDEFIAFMIALTDAQKKGEHDFTCPICGGEAHWERSTYNGHLRAYCDKCDTSIME